MPDIYASKPKIERVKLTVRVSLEAYDAIAELQHSHRKKTGRPLQLWKIVDEAILAFARKSQPGS